MGESLGARQSAVLAGLTEERMKRGVPDALVVTTGLGEVGFCCEPMRHLAKHPKAALVGKLTRVQMDAIREMALLDSKA